MKRALILTLLISACSWTSIANAQDFDPREAIVGAWFIDTESLLNQISKESDKQKQQMLAMTLGVFSRNILEIKENGVFVMGGVEADESFEFAVDDEGLLWLLKDNDTGMYFNCIRFETADRFVALPNPDKGFLVQVEFYRVFSQEMLDAGNTDPDLENTMTGLWEIDHMRLKTMPWIESIKDSKMREQILTGLKSGARFDAVGFKDGGVYVKTEERKTPTRLTDYSVLAAEDITLAISIRSFLQQDPRLSIEPDPQWPLSKVEIVDIDHMIFLWTAVAPGPLPMVRSRDVPLP